MTYQTDIIAMHSMLEWNQSGRRRSFAVDTREPLHFWPRKKPAPVETAYVPEANPKHPIGLGK